MMQHTSLHSAIPYRILSCFMALVLICTLSSWPPITPAYADELADKQAEAAVALANLNAMQSELDRLSNDYGEALMAQEAAELECEHAQQRIDQIAKEIEDLQARLSVRARDMYRTGNSTILDMILGAASFIELATNWEILNKVNENDAQMVAQRKALRIEAEEQQAILQEQAALATEKAEEAARAAADAEEMVAQMQAIYDGLSAEVAELLEAQRQAEIAAEQARLAALAAANNGSNNGDGGGNNGGGSSSNYNSATDNTPVQQPFEGGTDPVSRAYACLGAPYVWGGTGPYGYDCSGLVGYCLTGSHGRLGTTGTFIAWPEVSDPQPGDVCVIHIPGGSQHTGLYIGGGQMIHAATFGVGVIIGPVQAGMKIVRYPG